MINSNSSEIDKLLDIEISLEKEQNLKPIKKCVAYCKLCMESLSVQRLYLL